MDNGAESLATAQPKTVVSLAELVRSVWASLDMLASPDDEIFKRGTSSPAVRDNLLVEFGLFAGVLGRRRTFVSKCPEG